MNIVFTKMSGAGNDFVVVDNRTGEIIDGPSAARKLCDRRWGVGADGLLLLEKSQKADYRMMYYNADGSYGGMCGNGGRCIAYFASSNKVSNANHSFEALDYVYNAQVNGDHVMLAMKPVVSPSLNIVLRLNGENLKLHFVDSGSPHVVIPVVKGDLVDTDVRGLGRKIRSHKRFSPGGTNVNFIELGGDKSVHVRTYERGVEDETLACGTGSIASAVVAHAIWKLEPPVSIIPASGMELRVSFEKGKGRYDGITLEGPAKVVFSGSMNV